MKRNLISAIVSSAALFSMPAAQAQDLPAMQWTSHEVNYPTDVAPVFCQLPAQFLNTWQTQKNLYTPFATYSLTPEQQAAYLLLIKKIWPWVYDDMEAWEVNDEMAEIVSIVLEEIANCSKAMVYPQALAFFYDYLINRRIERILNGISGVTLIYPEFISTGNSSIFAIINLVDNNRYYKSCVYTAAWQWRSAFEIAYGNY